MFKGMDFIFNDIPSETYGLKIGFFDGSGIKDSFSGIRRSIEEYKIKRKSKPLYHGVEVTDKIEFDLVVYSESEIDTYDRQAIDNWLYLNEYAYFSIVQEDYENLFFRCIITQSEKIEIGNVPYAKTLHFSCDDAYAYSNIYNYAYTSTTTPVTYNIENFSNLNEYTYVEDMTITMATAGTVKITNVSESNRIFEITGLSSGEVLTINNDNKMLISSVASDRIGLFNKKWFRLIPHVNQVKLEGNFNIVMNVRYRLTI